jgi:hypothetical protein
MACAQVVKLHAATRHAAANNARRVDLRIVNPPLCQHPINPSRYRLREVLAPAVIENYGDAGAALLSSPRSPSITVRIFSSAENRRRSKY